METSQIGQRHGEASTINALAAVRLDPWRVSLAAAIGSFLEYYDFGVYGVLAISLAPLFFPAGDATASLLSALLVYAFAFVVRPVGAVFFGWLGDRHGRKNALIATIIGMGLTSALVGVLPTYARIGSLAPILLVLLRIAQGFFAGGEVSGAATYVAECSPEGRRGFFGSINVAGVVAGGAGAAITAAIVRTMVSHTALLSWGWRIPFFLSLPLLFVGLYARLRLADSPHFLEVAERHETAKAPLHTVLTQHLGGLLQTMGLAFGMTLTGLFSSVYLFIYLVHVVKLPLAWASWVFAIVELVAVCLIPLVGWLSDRIGRKPPVVLGFLGYLVITPLSMIVMHDQNLALDAFMLLLLAVPHAAVQGAAYPIYPELFPTSVRYTGMATGFNVAIVLGGGLAPYISTLLAGLTGASWAPSLYVMFGSVVALITLATIRDVRRSPLAD